MTHPIPASVLRTIVPLVVGLLLTAALKLGVHIDSGVATDAVTAGITAVYYGGVRLLESKVPAFGWLLGLAKSPTYQAAQPALSALGAEVVTQIDALIAGQTSPVTLTVQPPVPAAVAVVPPPAAPAAVAAPVA